MSYSGIMSRAATVRASAMQAAMFQRRHHQFNVTGGSDDPVALPPGNAAIDEIPDLFEPLALRFTGSLDAMRTMINRPLTGLNTILDNKAITILGSTDANLGLHQASDEQLQGHTRQELGSRLAETFAASVSQKAAIGYLNESIDGVEKLLEAAYEDLCDIADQAEAQFNLISGAGSGGIDASVMLRLLGAAVSFASGSPAGIAAGSVQVLTVVADGGKAPQSPIQGPWVEDVITSMTGAITELEQSLEKREREVGNYLNGAIEYLERYPDQILPTRVTSDIPS